MHAGHVRSVTPPANTLTVGQHSCVLSVVPHSHNAEGIHTTRATDATSHTLVTLQAVHFSCPWPGQILRPCGACASCQPDSCGTGACQCLPECERQVLARRAQIPVVQVQFCRPLFVVLIHWGLARHAIACWLLDVRHHNPPKRTCEKGADDVAEHNTSVERIRRADFHLCSPCPFLPVYNTLATGPQRPV